MINEALAKQGLIPIPKPRSIPAPTALPAPGVIQNPAPIQPAGVLPPLMGTAATPTVPVPTLAKPLVTGEATPPPARGAMTTAGQRPKGIPPPQRMRTVTQAMGMPSPEHFWRGTARVPTNLPRPEDYWYGAKTSSQIYLPSPEEFWRG